MVPSVVLSLLLAAFASSASAHGHAQDGRRAQHHRLALRSELASPPASASTADLSQTPSTARLGHQKRADVVSGTTWVTETVTHTSTRQLTIRAAPSASPALASSVTVDGTTWTYSGCLVDDMKTLLSGYADKLSTLTPSVCAALCASKGYVYAGVEYSSRCFCGNTLDTSTGLGAKLADAQCYRPCAGDASLTCGHLNKMQLYKLDTTDLITSGNTKWAYQGCIQDTATGSILTGSYQTSSSLTPSSCIATCLSQGYSMAGVEYSSRCYCGDKVNTGSTYGSAVADSDCSRPCTGDRSLTCGHLRKLQLYSIVSGTVPSKAITLGSSTTLISSTATSMSISTTTSTSASATPTTDSSLTVSGTFWTYSGCRVDDMTGTLLSGYYKALSTNTPSVCIALCLSQGFIYAGVEYSSRCYCGNTLDKSTGLGATVADTACSRPCTGDRSLTCGHLNKMQLYKLDTTDLITSGNTKWAYQGCELTPTSPSCIQDTATGSILTGSYQTSSSLTPSSCIATCLSQGYSMAGVEYSSRCYCGDKVNTGSTYGSAVADSDCSRPCTGDRSLTCGHLRKLQLYSIASGTPAETSTSSSVSSSSVSSAFSSSASSPVSASKSSIVSSKTSSSSAAASATPTAKWTYSHCAYDYPYSPSAGRSLTGAGPLNAPAGSSGMTNVLCQSMCETRGYTMAGTQAGTECWCGNYLDNGNGYSVAASDCSAACSGGSGSCGGGWRLSIYTSSKLAQWTLKDSHEGSSFFDGWNWYSGTDPTNGFVDYVTWQDAFSLGLASVNAAGQAIMKVETTPVVTTAGRKSTRLSTSWWFNSGTLLVMDAAHMPVGCGVWPAWWTLGGGDWPYTGEIDILEGVHFFTQNLQSVHTGSGCSIPSLFGGTAVLEGSNNCAALETGNTGCGMRSPASSTNSYGVSFNNNGGGVYAMLWTDAHIEVYFFPRNSIPSDITNKAPTPDKGGWGQPVARWPATNCSPLSNFFKDHNGIFDITFCGDWAGSAWTSAYPDEGQPSSCAALTGYGTCKDYVQNRGGDFSEAYWSINYVRLYSQ